MQRARRRKRLLIISVGVLLSGCTSQVTPTTSDMAFVSAMIPHHELGLELLDIGAHSVDDVRLRRLIFEMNNYHADDHARLMQWSFEWGTREADNFPGKITDSEMRALATMTGSEFDREWLRLMIAHHRGALEIAAVDSENQDVSLLATRIESIQRQEIELMESLLHTLT